jgi:hypothetical protein
MRRCLHALPVLSRTRVQAGQASAPQNAKAGARAAALTLARVVVERELVRMRTEQDGVHFFDALILQIGLQ